jgi:hypothetical protein
MRTLYNNTYRALFLIPNKGKEQAKNADLETAIVSTHCKFQVNHKARLDFLKACE